MYVEWHSMERAGLTWAQRSVLPLWERTQRFRFYSPWLIPGPVQTASYIKALLTSVRDRRRLKDDIDTAVEVRVEKQKAVYSNRQFAILLEEDALYHRVGGAEILAGQLGYLLTVMALPTVSIGIIPRDVERAFMPVEGFFLFDEHTVNVELVSAYLTVVQKHEVAMYVETFTDLAKLAVHGHGARDLITKAINSLD